ncbi:MAG TPA: hypothetical protein VKY31_15680, partial [Terriglobia bacterium]|nr:hypothetical protein [Terriglobia bacterium]
MFSTMRMDPFAFARMWLLSYFLLGSFNLLAQSAPPSRWQAQYTQIYFDDLEAIGSAVSPAFSLGPAGSFTANPAEVISGTESIKGSYTGLGVNTPYLQTNPSVLPLTANHSYKLTFQYKILSSPSISFATSFYSPTGGVPGGDIELTGAAGTSGTATITQTLGSYADYRVGWVIRGTGAIVIDNIQLTDAATGAAVASENAERTGPMLGSGLVLNGGSIVTDPSLVLSGKASIRLQNGGGFQTNPATLPLSANTTYILEFQYRILNPGSGTQTLGASFQPAGAAYNPQSTVTLPWLLPNAAVTGTFSTGALTANGGPWVLVVQAKYGCDVIVDNIAIIRQDSQKTASIPDSWSRLNQLPYPRLGHAVLGTTLEMAIGSGVPQDQVEGVLAFGDVIGGLDPDIQTQAPDSVRRLRQLNPGAVILPYRITEEQTNPLPAPNGSNVSLDYQFLKGISDSWYLKTSKGTNVTDPGYPNILKMNISQYCPIVNGDSYFSYLLKWLTGTIYSSGIWDGHDADNLFGRINEHILNFS